MSTPDIWSLLDQDAPDGCAGVQDLYSWSLNYDAGKGPFPLFLDLIGWSDDHLGVRLQDVPGVFGTIELAKLARALDEFANHPTVVLGYVDDLMEAESV